MNIQYGQDAPYIQRFSLLFLRLSEVFAFSLLLTFTTLVMANPEGGQVSAGSATISNTTTPIGNRTDITQTSDKAIIDWRTFNIGATETTNFSQPSSTSMTLNRVDGELGASNILGKLTANGQIWVVNPSGIFFGAGSMVDVAGLVASTAKITNEDFMAGNYHFTNGQGSVINAGTIHIADGGFVALVAPGVANNGVIEAKLGEVVLASGKDFTVDFYGDNLINFDATGEATAMPNDEKGQAMRDAVSNTGTIIADGGKVILTAHTMEGIVDHVINTSGVIQANSVSVVKGEIILSGGPTGIVNVSGKIEASGKLPGEQGGTVKILGEKVGLVENAEVIATGSAGGGEILIGGNVHGEGPERNAMYTYVGPNVRVNASAITSGDGGKIAVWSDVRTRFRGEIFSQGGAEGGNGGFVETSSRGQLSIRGGKVDVTAPNGNTGTWLLDPSNIFIAVDQASATAAGMQGTDSTANIGSGDDPNIFSAMGAAEDSLLTTDTLETALRTANVIITTNNYAGMGVGDITIVDPITWTSTHNLTLIADNDINFNAFVTGSNGSLSLGAGGFISQNSAGGVNVGELTIYDSYSELTGTVGGFSGIEGARRVQVIGGYYGKNLFNGFDLFEVENISQNPAVAFMDMLGIDPGMPEYKLESRPSSLSSQRVCSAG